MSNPKFRHMTFNINTNGSLETINSYLICESDDHSPHYISAAKGVDTAELAKLSNMLKAVNTEEYKEDAALDSVRYKLYLCYALISYLKGDKDRSKELFEKTFGFEEHSMADYYQEIARTVGVKLSKKRKEKQGFRSPLANHFSSWTDGEVSRYATLRAIEWVSLPSFIAIGLGPIFLAIIPPIQLAVGVVIVDIIWRFISAAFYVYWLSNLSIWLNKLKWLSAPGMAGLFLVNHDVRLAIIAFLWPLIGLVLTFPSALISGLVGGKNTGKVEQRICARIENQK